MTPSRWKVVRQIGLVYVCNATNVHGFTQNHQNDVQFTIYAEQKSLGPTIHNQGCQLGRPFRGQK